MPKDMILASPYVNVTRGVIFFKGAVSENAGLIFSPAALFFGLLAAGWHLCSGK
jgi:hypothetical protein